MGRDKRDRESLIFRWVARIERRKCWVGEMGRKMRE